MLKTNWKTRLAGLAGGIALAFAGLSGGTAFAWTYGLSGTGACQPDGSFKITWTVDNTTENEALHITASSDASVVPVGTDVAAHQTQDFTQTASGTAAANFSLSLTGNFASDQTLRVRDASVSLSNPCGGRGGGPQNVTLCHATGSTSNPYVSITVDTDGAYNGHYTQHQGPVFNGSVSSWGDIIPPFDFNGQTYSLNWDSSGQAIYNNGCVVGGMGGGGSTTSTPATPATTTASTPKVLGASTTQVAVVPTGSVNGGGGAASKTSNPVALVGLLSSLVGVGTGMSVLKRRQL